jgi:Flp pilus assembly protein TadD
LALIKGQDEISFLEETVAHNPDATAPALVLAKKLLEAGRDQDAEPYLKFLEKKGHADAPYLRGAIAGRRGEFVAAIAHTQRALEMEPNHQGAKNQMDVLLRAMGR